MLVDKLVLQTAYLKTLEQFYSSVLQLQVNGISDREIEISIGATTLVFSETQEAEPFYHFAINIPSNKIEEARIWLTEKVKLLWMDDYKSDIADFVDWHAKSVYFYDPAGNIVELIARFDLSNETEETFSSNQFLCVNEVGIVFNKEVFESKTIELLRKYSLPYFEKQPPQPQFRAIGDDNGLFIVVPEHRNWYPTNKPAEIFPMKVEFENDGRRQLNIK